MNKQFLMSVAAGLVTLTAWELVLKPRLGRPQPEPVDEGYSWWPF